MKTSRRGLFRLILALPFAPKCVQAFRRPKAAQRSGNTVNVATGWAGGLDLKPGDIITFASVYKLNPIRIIPDAPFTIIPSAGIHVFGDPSLDDISTFALQCDRDVFKAESGGYGEIFPTRKLKVGDTIQVRRPARFRA